ncbi:hypothetical protein L7F22_002851 [Adiantum nelumboides]|nr:hypothetical protein [Adiantum nelumboides]
MVAPPISSCRRELRRAVGQLRERGLYAASKWAAEQLVGLSEDARTPGPTPVMFSNEKASSKKSSKREEDVAAESESMLVEEEEEEEDDIFLLAKSYFDMREYRRAAHVLNGVPGKKPLFLRCYATYLVRTGRFSSSATLIPNID